LAERGIETVVLGGSDGGRIWRHSLGQNPHDSRVAHAVSRRLGDAKDKDLFAARADYFLSA